MGYEQVLYEVDGGVAIITLNRPDKLNAFTGTMGQELWDAFNCALGDDAVRAIIFTGAGRAFCAGVDLQAVAQPGQQGFTGMGQRLQPGEGQEAARTLDRVNRPEDPGNQFARLWLLLKCHQVLVNLVQVLVAFHEEFADDLTKIFHGCTSCGV